MMVRAPGPGTLFAPRETAFEATQASEREDAPAGAAAWPGVQVQPPGRRSEPGLLSGKPRPGLRLYAARCIHCCMSKQMFDTDLQAERSHSEQVLRNRRPWFRNPLSSEDSLLCSSDLPGLLLRAGLCTKDTGKTHWPCPQEPHELGKKERCQHREPNNPRGTCRKYGKDRKGGAQRVTDSNTQKGARNVSLWDSDSRIFPPLEAVLFGPAGALPCGTSC